MGELTNITLDGKPLATHNQIKKAATAQTLDVCQHAENSVTLCNCGKAAKKKYCSDACRQKAYRTSAAFLANKKRWEDARMARRADHYQRRNRSRALSPLHGYSGPVAGGVPRLGDLNLKNYLDEKHFAHDELAVRQPDRGGRNARAE